MGTYAYTGTVTTLQDAKLMETIPNARLAGGVVHCSVDRCVATTALGLTLASTFKVAKLPAGAIVLYSIVYGIADATFDAPDATTGATLISLGTLTDVNLFGSISTTLAVTVPQVLVPSPDGTIYANRLAPLLVDSDVYVTSSAVDWTDTEGVVVMIFYTF
ncbi:MAG: hypothetical protein IMZ53_13435 [Thermoplasmata archaeon]|nr:hypothetical protein [Thermoplasmata archaeon]